MKLNEIEFELRKVAAPGDTVFLRVTRIVTDDAMQELAHEVQRFSDQFGVHIVVLDTGMDVVIDSRKTEDPK